VALLSPEEESVVTRFAPSPTGYLHLGHVRSAWEGFAAAREAGGRFLLRIEDIDQTRCREEYTQAILEDLLWLGLRWDGPVRRQSEHFADYRAALDRLAAAGLLYPCFCTRREIMAEIARSGAAPQGEEGVPYPGICRRLDAAERARRIEAGRDYALRLDVAAAAERGGAARLDRGSRGRRRAAARGAASPR
jgi:glutamyl-Q tRNA(Asp) synthetase